MPQELVVVGVALLFGAWLVIDQRSMTEKFGLIVIVIIIYAIFQYLGGPSLTDTFGPVLDFFNTGSNPPPIEE